MTTANATTGLTTFRDQAAEHLDRLAAYRGVEFLTVNGQTKGVVMAPDVFDRMADRIEQAEITEGIRRGLADVAADRVVPAREVMDKLDAELADTFSSIPSDPIHGRRRPGGVGGHPGAGLADRDGPAGTGQRPSMVDAIR